jgi:hypothetical protein
LLFFRLLFEASDWPKLCMEFLKKYLTPKSMEFEVKIKNSVGDVISCSAQGSYVVTQNGSAMYDILEITPTFDFEIPVE